MGGKKRARPLHPFEDDVLGGARSRRQARPSRPGSGSPSETVGTRGESCPDLRRGQRLVGSQAELRAVGGKQRARREPSDGGSARLRRSRRSPASSDGSRHTERAREGTAALPLYG